MQKKVKKPKEEKVKKLEILQGLGVAQWVKSKRQKKERKKEREREKDRKYK